MPVQSLLSIKPDKLFEEHTVAEIQEIQKKLQWEIERKREELRNMVGERYRDMIEAADTIRDMKTTSESVISQINRMKDKCCELQEKHLLGFKLDAPKVKAESVSGQVAHHSLAVQIKILISIPEEIWRAIEEENYLQGTRLFLFARHIHTDLVLNPRDDLPGSRVASCFPVIAHQWSSISHFQSSIPTNCERKLQQVNLTTEEATNCLCSLVLLGGLTPLELLNKLLSLRTQALEAVLQSDQFVSVKSRICSSMRLLVHTMSMLYSCFIDGCPDAAVPEGTVWKQLKKIVGRDAPSSLTLINIEDEIGIKFLPPRIRDYRISTKEKVEPVAPSAMRESLNHWLDWVRDFTCSHVGKLLQLVNSLRILQTIRSEARTSVTIPENWEIMCQKLLIPKGLHLWNNFFQPLLTARAKELLTVQLNSILDDLCFVTLKSIKTDLTSKKSNQHDIRWFIWKEQPSDLPQNNRKDSIKPVAKGLLMKAKGFSPCIEKLCSKFDSLLHAILNDVNYYVGGNDKDNVLTKLETYIDSDDLLVHLQTASKNGLHRIIDYILSLCEEVNKEVNNEACLLFMARFLQAVCDLCPNVQKCLAPKNHHVALPSGGNLFLEVCTTFKQKSLLVWQMWQMTVSSKFREMIATKLKHEVKLTDLLHSFPMWDVINIEEEGEEGYSVKSDIRVPSQPSLPLQSLLSEVCQKLNTVGPHTLPRKIHQDLVEHLVTDIYNSYSEARVKDGLGQPQALQYLLDVKYISMLLIPRDNKILTTRCQEICDKLEDKIDPFDLDVFCPYIQNNIKRSVQRTQGLMGILIAWPDKLAVVSGLRPSSQHGVEDPSVLPICNSAPWFPLLPVTGPPGIRMPLAPTQQPQVVERSQVVKKTANLKTKGEPSPGDIVRSGAAAFFGAMSSDWFGSS